MIISRKIISIKFVSFIFKPHRKAMRFFPKTIFFYYIILSILTF